MKQGRFLTSALAAAAILATALTAASPARAADGLGCVQVSGHTVCSTDPGGGKDTAIVEELVRQIDRTGRGDTIRVAVYQWTLEKDVKPIADGLVDAQKRGVDVKAVIGQRSDRPGENDAVIAKFEKAGIGVEQCRGGCLPNPKGTSNGPAHNRFFLIERDGTPSVITTSFNLTGFHVTQAHNLLAVHGDEDLFAGYRAYWHRMYTGSWDGWGEKAKAVSGDDGSRAWFFPRSSDPVAAQLSNVTGCGGGDRVWVAHANFQPNRPEVRKELGRIDDLGCDVRSVVLDADANDPGWIEKATGSGSVRVHDSLRDKFILVDAEWNGKARQFVFGGTHNLNGNGMKNADDNLLRVSDEAVAGVYADYFQVLWKSAS